MDILLGKDGKVKFDGFRLSITDELPDKVAQRLFIRLRSNKGHWFMDKTYGVEWLNAIFGKRKTQAAIDTILQTEIYKDKYVMEIINWKSDIADRSYSCQFTVRISNLDDNLLTIRLLANEFGFVLQDSEGNQYQIT